MSEDFYSKNPDRLPAHIYTSVRYKGDLITLGTAPNLSAGRQEKIQQSGNAMRGFVIPVDTLPPETPWVQYLHVYYKGEFLGLVLLEYGTGLGESEYVYIHPLIIKKDRDLFARIAEMCIVLLRGYGLKPQTAVEDSDKYLYMSLFLTTVLGLGGFDIRPCGEKKFLGFYVPSAWKPRHIRSDRSVDSVDSVDYTPDSTTSTQSTQEEDQK